MSESSLETSASAIANTTMSERELLIHALQHLEDMYEKNAETHAAVMRLDGQLSAFAPLLAQFAPGGKPDFISIMQSRRGFRRGSQQ